MCRVRVASAEGALSRNRQLRCTANELFHGNATLAWVQLLRPPQCLRAIAWIGNDLHFASCEPPLLLERPKVLRRQRSLLPAHT